MKMPHWIMAGVLLSFAAFVVVIGCSQSTPVDPGLVSGSADAQAVANDDFTTLARKKKTTRKKTDQRAQPYATRLSGAQEVPPVDTEASGFAHFVYDSGKDEIRYSLHVKNITEVVGAHIHMAPEGENGPVVASLFSGDPFSGNGQLAHGTLTADDLVGPLDGEPLHELMYRFDLGRAYVNVHTTAYPGGEIRGQIDETSNPQRPAKKKATKKKAHKKKANP